MSVRTRGLSASAVAAVVVAAFAAGCASSTKAASGGGSSPGGADSATAAAQAQVQKLEATTSSYPIPAAPVSGVSALAGKTVFYIPLDQHIPQFATAAVTLGDALKKAGLREQVCDGGGDPNAVANCVQQAEGAGAAAVITDAIPHDMAPAAFDGLKAKNIPLIFADQFRPSGQSDDNSVAYVEGVTDQPSQIAWWVIADSKGKANIVIAEEADSDSSKQYVTDAVALFKDKCPDCKVTVKTITATTDAQLASDTAANILSNPLATYYYTEFEDSLQGTVDGIQTAGKTSSIALEVAGGTTNGLGMLKSGAQGVKAVVSVDAAYSGWALADEALRMMTKSGPVEEKYPSRLFTADNIGSVDVSDAAFNSGAWFGDSSFTTSFAKLWGVG